MPPVIITENLEFSYGDVPVLRGLDLSVQAGDADSRLHDLILARVDDEATIVMTTHDLTEAEHLASQVLVCLPLIVLSAVATAPLGFLLGALVRGVYTFMITYLPVFALIGTSGFFMPMDRLPQWVQAVQLALPTYWSGHLTRWALVGDPSWEVGGAFSPVLAAGVLAAWTVIGFAGASFVVRRSFREETIGSLARMQSTIRSQTGL